MDGWIDGWMDDLFWDSSSDQFQVRQLPLAVENKNYMHLNKKI